MKHKRTQASTLVELIVTITILSILGTIGMVSFRDYASSARDSARTSDMASIRSGLETYRARSARIPLPDGPSVALYASGNANTYAWQGYAGKSTLGVIRFSGDGKDPEDGSYYTYVTNVSGTKYQLLGLTENGIWSSGLAASFGPGFVDTAYAEDRYANRFPYTVGNSLGVVLATGSGGTGTKNQPIQENYQAGAFTGIDMAKTATAYQLAFSANDLMTASGDSLFSAALSRNGDMAKSGTLATLDDSLIGYWDMETLSGWSVRDLAGKTGDAKCKRIETGIVPCDGSVGTKIVTMNGGTEKGIELDGTTYLDAPIANFATLAVRDFSVVTTFQSTATGGQRCVVSTDGDGAAWFRVWFGSRAYVLHGSNNGTSYQEWTVNSALLNDGKIHRTVSNFRMGVGVDIYVDGVFAGTFSTPGLANSVAYKYSQYLLFGTMNGSSSGTFPVTIGEVRLYNRLLPAKESEILSAIATP